MNEAKTCPDYSDCLCLYTYRGRLFISLSYIDRYGGVPGDFYSFREGGSCCGSGGSKGRKRGAVALLRKGYASKIMFTGYDIDIRDYQCQGISEKETVLPPMAAYTTYEEALAVRRATEEGNSHSVIIVTFPYHLRRASFISHKIFNGKDIKLMFYVCQNKAFQMDTWWKSYISRKMVLMEYLGLVYYWVRY